MRCLLAFSNVSLRNAVRIVRRIGFISQIEGGLSRDEFIVSPGDTFSSFAFLIFKVEMFIQKSILPVIV